MACTSLDGITSALVEITEVRTPLPQGPSIQVRLLAHQTQPYTRELRIVLLKLSTHGTVFELANMDVFLGELFAEAAQAMVTKAGLTLSDVALISSHGQTICHFPKGLPKRKDHSFLAYPSQRSCSLQIGDIDVIATRTGITTVGDFRPKDMAVGGQGAPSFPMPTTSSFGIPNFAGLYSTLEVSPTSLNLPAGASLESVQAFDTGPGNMVIDGLVRRMSDGALPYGKGGAMASRGKAHDPLVRFLMDHPFITQEPLKSTVREEFGDAFVNELWAQAKRMGLSDEDLVATATAFTAEAVVLNCREFLGHVDEIIVSGGGAYNRTLMGYLTEQWPEVKVTTTLEYAIPVEAKEALGFAVLGYQVLQRRPNHVPSCTGARHSVVMGKISWGK